MKYCRNCGAPLDDDALFCRECGNKVDVAPPVMTPPVVPPPVIPQPAAPQSVAPQSVGAQPVVPPVMPQPQVTETFTHDENETFIEVEPDYNLYYIIGGVVAAVLLAVGGWSFYTHHNNGNNPLDVQKPKWEKFVMVNAEGVNLYKEADMSSPCLQNAVEQIESCAYGEKMLWQGDKAPRGYKVSDYEAGLGKVFPVIDESESWYKVHIGTGEIREAYLQKKYCEEVKPTPITKEIIDKVKSNESYSYRFVEKGEFANLVIRHEEESVDTPESLSLGVLTDGCIVMPKECVCFPTMTDTTGVDIHHINDHYGYRWHLTCPESYGKKVENSLSSLVFDLNKLTDDDIRKIVMSLRTSSSTDTKALYYFPNISKDYFVEFEYSFSPAQTTEVEEDKQVTRYYVDGMELKADFGGNVVTAKTFEGKGLYLDAQFDIDGDGSLECVLTVYSGGNMGDYPFVVTYDAEADNFVSSDDLPYRTTPAIEEKDGRPTMVQRSGLHWMRYVIENHSLRKVEDNMKSYGTVRAVLELDNVYADEEQGDTNVKFDFDGDGNDDNLALYRGLVHAYGYGSYMILKTVELADGTSRDIDLRAAKFSFLNSRTYGMPDIICDDFLFRWDGSQYESYGWDGKNIVRENEL